MEPSVQTKPEEWSSALLPSPVQPTSRNMSWKPIQALPPPSAMRAALVASLWMEARWPPLRRQAISASAMFFWPSPML